ncbi:MULTISPECIES: extracellular solute-binding protein [unclassified Paenibacillus]|uniref:ABC transporter substrate-binding protein n=1 Tax=unclassified Paenibacillus TaxID=185978 RepID=UPI001AE99090|nr:MULTISPECIES: extracellular solute-binding protein [unclassified Paenibacillus]MBP1154918.1 iron(III) transport system substrate-binding protein [Paenibacillus sp. PvP091]MBP1169698.1 iron(III) transport system substrate-binding protein [Paenibacillus sp. PvR098]MBP2440726.1 iron(III) transport system substrate-binding protein [Paenibacillus sp. PvP052]
MNKKAIKVASMSTLSLVLVCLISACGASTSQPGEPQQQAVTAPNKSKADDWNAIVKAAQEEGTVNCGCPPRPDFTKILKEGFEAAYPGITLEATPATLPEFPLRVVNEQQAGKYLWDVYMFGPGPEIFELKNKGNLEPFLDYVTLPEVLDGSVYEGGLQSAFLDTDKKYIFSMWWHANSIGVNRNMFSDDGIDSFDDLYDPKYKGKIVWVDPRGGGSGSSYAAFVLSKYGKDGLKKILVDQEAMLVKGNVEAAEQLIRGGKGISIPDISYDAFVQYEKAGVKTNIAATQKLKDLSFTSVGGSSPAVFKEPPHPNATKVFLNWVLSKEGQTLISEKLKNNSRRKDVPVANPALQPIPGVEYFNSHSEEGAKLQREAATIAKQLIP